MSEEKITQELPKQITPADTAEWLGLTKREVRVLLKRFGLTEKSEDDSSASVPPKGDGGNGSGGVPAPAKPFN